MATEENKDPELATNEHWRDEMITCEPDSERAITLGMPNEAFADRERERGVARDGGEDIQEMVKRLRERRPDVYAHLLALLRSLNSSEC